MRWLENATGRAFGGARRPLLVSVRSTPVVSMPGMLSTVLNVGLNHRAVRGLLRLTGNPRLPWDLYRRLLESFATSVRGGAREPFEAALRARMAEADAPTMQELDAEALRALAREHLDLVLEESGAAFSPDPMEQLTEAVEAVFRSWERPRAVEYRRLAGLDATAGTGVIVQAMVYGNAGGTSGSGVAFTRDPVDGRDALPAAAADLDRIKTVLEDEFGDMQDVEFTVEDGRLFLLQTRDGKRTPWAALRIAVDMVQAGLVDAETALARLRAIDLDAIERTSFAGPMPLHPLATGIPAGLGVAVGAVAFDVARARATSRRRARRSSSCAGRCPRTTSPASRSPPGC